jgi:hypothetical protein
MPANLIQPAARCRLLNLDPRQRKSLRHWTSGGESHDLFRSSLATIKSVARGDCPAVESLLKPLYALSR